MCCLNLTTELNFLFKKQEKVALSLAWFLGRMLHLHNSAFHWNFLFKKYWDCIFCFVFPKLLLTPPEKVETSLYYFLLCCVPDIVWTFIKFQLLFLVIVYHTISRMWHKVDIYEEHSWFEFRVFLLDWLPYHWG